MKNSCFTNAADVAESCDRAGARQQNPHLRALLVAGILLAAGAAYYVVVRPTGPALLPSTWHLQSPWHTLAPGFDWLPTLVHTAAMSLLCAIAAAARGRAVGAICAAWAGINVAFEIGQHPSLAPALAAALPRWFADVPLLDLVAPFFLQGEFAVHDLAAAVVGAGAAWLYLARSVSHGFPEGAA